MTFYKFVNASVADADQVNANFNETLKTSVDNALLNTTTIDVQSTISSPFKIVDLFTDTTGDNNTVDTGTTTALYYTPNVYYLSIPVISATVLEPGFETVASWTYSEVDAGANFSGAQDAVWKTQGSNSYKLLAAFASDYVATNYCQILQSVDFTSLNQIVFDYNIVDSGGIVTGTLYAKAYIGATEIFSYLYSNAGNSSGTIVYNCSAISGAQDLIFKLILTADDTVNNAARSFAVDNIRDNFSNALIQSVSTSVGTGFNYAYVRPKLYEAIPTGATATCYVSLNGGSNWSAESAINEIIDVSALTDTGNLMVKLNLNTTGTNTAKVLGWSALLFE